MASPMFKTLQNIFTLSCIIATLCFTSKCIHQYMLNEDTSSVSFENFHAHEESLYPSVSLCFKGDIFKEDFEQFASYCVHNRFVDYRISLHVQIQCIKKDIRQKLKVEETWNFYYFDSIKTWNTQIKLFMLPK